MLILMTASGAEIAHAHDAYVNGVRDAQLRIREHFRETAGPNADGSLESLVKIGPWFFAQLPEMGETTSSEWIPPWWNPADPPAGAVGGNVSPFTRQQLRLIDEMHAYVAEVLMRHIPGAEWIVIKGSRKNVRFGTTVLKVSGSRQFYPLSLVYNSAINIVQLDKPVSPTIFYDEVRRAIDVVD
ncbi:hypothetical protein [Cryobacterium sp. Y29]|uniref:hypothetical protein n=1 Tax=Cryobacterium sp. Y29 TaxID=2048285 RepID=UPI0011B021C5|nr:hypothetical protein [Cryobacterium sp. Y29]